MRPFSLFFSFLGFNYLTFVAHAFNILRNGIQSSITQRSSFSRLQMQSNEKQKKAFIFGLGYVGSALAEVLMVNGWEVCGTCTNVKKISQLRNKGVKAYLFDDYSGSMVQSDALDDLCSSSHILTTIPPSLSSGQGCDPVLRAHGDDLRRAALQFDSQLRWIGYISSTGVYGDCDGAWVTETNPVRPENEKTTLRANAESEWLTLQSRNGLPIHVFRLAGTIYIYSEGIYGPGRNALETLRRYNGDLAACGANDVTCTSRVHIKDIVSVVVASMSTPNFKDYVIYNVADDLPSTRYDSLVYSCRLFGLSVSAPPEYTSSQLKSPSNKGRGLSRIPQTRGGSKRVENTRMRQLLGSMGLSLIHPDYRSGLKEIFDEDFAQEVTVGRATSSSEPNEDALSYENDGFNQTVQISNVDLLERVLSLEAAVADLKLLNVRLLTRLDFIATELANKV